MTEQANKPWIAGFWKRALAFVLDALLLAGVGFVLGLLLGPVFIELGGWGRAVGFVVALAYFGIFESRIGHGQTPGKRLLKLQVVDVGNTPVSLPRSMARFSILGVPYFLNGASISNDILLSFWVFPLSLLVLGVGSALVYLALFNRGTRQSLHDWLVGTFVVNAAVPAQVPARVARVHRVMVALCFAAAAAGPLLLRHLAQTDPFSGLLSAQTALMQHPAVRYATLGSGGTTSPEHPGGANDVHYVLALVKLREDRVGSPELANELAAVIVAAYPAARTKTFIQVDLAYGFDIGIWSLSRSHEYMVEPQLLPDSGR